MSASQRWLEAVKSGVGVACAILRETDVSEVVMAVTD